MLETNAADGLWAEVYDAIYSDVRAEVREFYAEEARRSGGWILEVQCRTGDISLSIAEAGTNVVGLDDSPAMLEAARGRLGRREASEGSVSFLEGDPRDLSRSLDRKFDLVIMPFHGFQALLTAEDQSRCLRNVVRHLAPGGRLVLDVPMPDIDTLSQDNDVAYHVRDAGDPETGARYVLWEMSDYDDYTQIAQVRTIVEELDEGGVVARRLHHDAQVRYTFRWEMHHLLRLGGFEVLDLFGDFDRSPFDDDSTEMIWIAGARS